MGIMNGLLGASPDEDLDSEGGVTDVSGDGLANLCFPVALSSATGLARGGESSRFVSLTTTEISFKCSCEE